jgi:hypothetical protein
MKIKRPTLFTDNFEAAESIVKQDILKREPDHQRPKHIDIRFHFVRDHYSRARFSVQHVPTNQQLADIFTIVFSGRNDSVLSCNHDLASAAIF